MNKAKLEEKEGKTKQENKEANCHVAESSAWACFYRKFPGEISVKTEERVKKYEMGKSHERRKNIKRRRERINMKSENKRNTRTNTKKGNYYKRSCENKKED